IARERSSSIQKRLIAKITSYQEYCLTELPDGGSLYQVPEEWDDCWDIEESLENFNCYRHKFLKRDDVLALVMILRQMIIKLLWPSANKLQKPGILFNEALHWFWFDANKKALIVSFDLAKEDFKEIPQPDDTRYVWNMGCSLGIMDGRLCIFPYFDDDEDFPSCGTWVIKNYNVKPSWELLSKDCEMNDHAIYYILNNDTRRSTIMLAYSCDENIELSRTKEYILYPIFVQTLVSPFVNNNGGPSHAKNNKSTANAGSVERGIAYLRQDPLQPWNEMQPILGMRKMYFSKKVKANKQLFTESHDDVNKGELIEHYARLWEYRHAILDTNPGSTCILDDEEIEYGNSYFRRFYIYFKGVKDGWKAGCRRVIGLDGCFLKHTCRGEFVNI
nr:putative F-box domain-containing protein [Tanacetum cinerariifolium]